MRDIEVSTVETHANYAGTVAARLDRLPFSRTIWRMVLLISLGGVFELYDLFMTAYIAPGLVASGLFTTINSGGKVYH